MPFNYGLAYFFTVLFIKKLLEEIYFITYFYYFLSPTSNENNFLFIHHSNTREGDKNTIFVIVEWRVLKSSSNFYKLSK